MSTAPNGWQNPKTNWASADVPAPSDFNRIEGNLNAIENGNRTLDQAQAPASNTGSLRQLLDWFANRIKAILGTTNWYDAPPTTLSAAKTHIDRTDNPHGVTAAQIGAETPAGAQSKVDAHANRTDNPHGVTAAQIGAAAAKYIVPGTQYNFLYDGTQRQSSSPYYYQVFVPYAGRYRVNIKALTYSGGTTYIKVLIGGITSEHKVAASASTTSTSLVTLNLDMSVPVPAHGYFFIEVSNSGSTARTDELHIYGSDGTAENTFSYFFST